MSCTSYYGEYFDLKSMKTEDFAPSEADFLETNLEGVYDDPEISYDDDDDNTPSENFALYIESTKGKPCLLLNGYKYRKTYRSKRGAGTRWNCSMDKNCTAHLYLNDNDEIIKCDESHIHGIDENIDLNEGSKDSAVVVTSRKGKQMLLYHQYTYRKQYTGTQRSRWVCSTDKNCRAYVSTNSDNCIITVLEDHCHAPPKYYLKPDHVLEALAQPVILETD